jgi:hypothetical protein
LGEKDQSALHHNDDAFSEAWAARVSFDDIAIRLSLFDIDRFRNLRQEKLGKRSGTVLDDLLGGL